MRELHRQWGENLAFHMRAHGYTHESFAAALDMAQSSVTRWVRGECGPSDRAKIKIAALLKTEVRVLFPMVVGVPA